MKSKEALRLTEHFLNKFSVNFFFSLELALQSGVTNILKQTPLLQGLMQTTGWQQNRKKIQRIPKPQIYFYFSISYHNKW